MTEISYEIVKKCGLLSVSDSGWTKELNLVSFNRLDPKYDIREWSPDRKKMGKGIRLTKDELSKLYNLIEKDLEN
ncbi:YdbC family protein [Guggenheimella bovis]